MTAPSLILASRSEIRLNLLRAAGLQVTAEGARVDEELIRRSLEAEGAPPRDLADTLAEMKAVKVSERHAEAVVIGCDQVLEFSGRAWSKPATPEEAQTQLQSLRGRTHKLLSAVVIAEAGRPVWRHVGVARLTMRDFSDTYLGAYLQRNWPQIGESVGGYKLEEEGLRLFSAIEGDYFTILGLPMLPVLSYLAQRGFIES
jgi:septum formation protein